MKAIIFLSALTILISCSNVKQEITYETVNVPMVDTIRFGDYIHYSAYVYEKDTFVVTTYSPKMKHWKQSTIDYASRTNIDSVKCAAYQCAVISHKAELKNAKEVKALIRKAKRSKCY